MNNMFIILYTIPLLIGFYLNTLSSVCVRSIAESVLPNPYVPLPDLIHIYVPKIYTLIPDYFLFLCICTTIYYYSSLIDLEKHLLCVGICLIIRSITVFLTIMPTCMPKPTSQVNIYSRMFVSTHDLMFSGHTLFFIAIGSILNIFWIQLLGPFLLVISRQHYTIDVCVSGLIYYYVLSKINLLSISIRI